MPPSQPDLVLVMTDQQRHDHVGWKGLGPLRTPNLDALAASGVVFGAAYSASTTCIPARTSLMTGLLDHRTPYREKLALEQDFFTVPHALRAAGYQTALIGKMHFNPMRSSHGFEHVRVVEHLNAYSADPHDMELDHYHDFLHGRGLPDWRFEVPDADQVGYAYDIATHPTSWVRDEALAFLEQRDPTRPLLLVVSFPHPHPPVNPPEPYASMYDPRDCFVDPDGARLNAHLPGAFREATAQADHPHRRVDPANLAHHQQDLARTFGLINQIDDAVGDLLAALPLDDALLFFTSDHGDFGGRRGLVRKIPWIPFDDLARVPFFAAGGLVAGGRTVEAPVQTFDLATTFLDLAGIDVDLATFDGVSLADPLGRADGTFPDDRPVHCAISMRWPMVRRGAHKYIRNQGWKAHALFDVVLDPDESLDLSKWGPAADLVAELSALVDQQLAATIPDLPRFA